MSMWILVVVTWSLANEGPPKLTIGPNTYRSEKSCTIDADIFRGEPNREAHCKPLPETASSRTYSVEEIDALRSAVEQKYLYGNYSIKGQNRISRSFRSGEKDQAVEEQVRTWMAAGKTAEDLISSEK